VDYALRLPKELPDRTWWAGSYANDVMACIPSRRVRKEGGYEGEKAMVYYGLPAPWREEVEEVLVGGVKRVAATALASDGMGFAVPQVDWGQGFQWAVIHPANGFFSDVCKDPVLGCKKIREETDDDCKREHLYTIPMPAGI
jgi:hypothetical protein